MVKDILREIKKKWFQFVAILLITALGVGFFVGIQVTGYNMRITAYAYTKTNEIMDFYLSASLGVDDEFVSELEATLNASVNPIVSGNGFLSRDGDDEVVQAYEYSDATKMDITLLEGRLPEKDGEFLIDSTMALKHDLVLGTTYTFSKSEFLDSAELTLVGTVNSSLYFNQERGHSKLGAIGGFIYGQGLQSKTDLYAAVRIVAPEGADLNALEQQIESLQDDLVLNRYHRIVDPIKEELEDGQKELDANRVKANQEFDSAWSKILQSEMDLDDSKNEIINGVLEIYPEASGSNYIEYYENSVAYYETFKQETQDKFDASLKEILAMSEDTEMQKIMKATALQEYETQVEVDAGHEFIKDGIDQINEGEKALLDAKELFEKEKKEALAKLDEAQTEIDDAYTDLDNLDKGSFYKLNRDETIVGYRSFYDDSQRIEAIGKVFPLIFFGVAILVTLSTISRMIDESRIEIGIYKAMGYGRLRTTMKFVGFTFFAWIIGVVIGLLLGFQFIPVLIYNAYRIMYNTPELITGFIASYAFVPLLISFVASVGIAFYKSYKVSSEITASLLIPNAGMKGQRIFLERLGFIWNRLSFLYKVSLRNLFRNKTRFLMTIVGIGGCCGLLITGFGINYSINSIVDKQFDEVINYEAVVAIENGYDLDSSIISDAFYSEVIVENVTVEGQDLSIYAADSLNKLSKLIDMKDRISHKELNVTEDDIVITEKLALMNNLKVGDLLTIKMGDRGVELPITQITENYFAHYLYMSQSTYQKYFGQTKDPSLIILNQIEELNTDWDQILRNESHVLSVNVLQDLKASYIDMMGSFEIVIIVIVLAAFLLELIVLLNLISMNMSERSKELATLKVLGFYPKELSAYVLRENIILSLISIIVGIGFGVYLHRFVLLSAEIDLIMFNRVLKPSAVLLACVLTFALSLLTNLFMSRRANQVNMAEALKGE